jgi:hypothetical protein
MMSEIAVDNAHVPTARMPNPSREYCILKIVPGEYLQHDSFPRVTEELKQGLHP